MAVCVPVANIAVFSAAVVVSASIVAHIIALADFVVAVVVVDAAVVADVVFVAPENWKKNRCKKLGREISHQKITRSFVSLASSLKQKMNKTSS